MIRLQPDRAITYVTRGMITTILAGEPNKDNLEQYEAAIADYDEAIRLQPDFMLAYLSRSATNTMLGREDAARSDYENILQFESPFIEDIDTKDIDTDIIEIIDIKDIEEKE